MSRGYLVYINGAVCDDTPKLPAPVVALQVSLFHPKTIDSRCILKNRLQTIICFCRESFCVDVKNNSCVCVDCPIQAPVMRAVPAGRVVTVVKGSKKPVDSTAESAAVAPPTLSTADPPASQPSTLPSSTPSSALSADQPLIVQNLVSGALPLSQVLVCSDSPNCTPQNIYDNAVRTSRNEPSNLSAVFAGLAHLLSKPVNEIQSATYASARQFFSMMEDVEETDKQVPFLLLLRLLR